MPTNRTPKPPSFREIADHIGVSKGMVAKLKSKGMPVSSLRAAKLWRSRQVLLRAPTHATKDRSEIGEVPLPKLRREPRLRKPLVPARTEDSLQDALANAISVNNAAFELFEGARCRGGYGQLGPYVQIYSKSLDMRLKAERMVREEMERRGVLVNYHELIEKIRGCMNLVLKRLKRLPDEAGPMCNPQDPLHAYEVLQREVNDVLLTGQQAIAAM